MKLSTILFFVLISFSLLVEADEKWQNKFYTKNHKPDSRRAECFAAGNQELGGFYHVHWDKSKGEFYDLKPGEVREFETLSFSVPEIENSEGGLAFIAENSKVFLAGFNGKNAIFKNVLVDGDINKYGLQAEVNDGLLSEFKKIDRLEIKFTLEGGINKTSSAEISKEAKKGIEFVQSCRNKHNFF